MDLGLIAAAGVATGTVLLFAAIGEIFAERAGVLNLGVEGMMLMGAVAGFSATAVDRQPVDRARRRDDHRRPDGAPPRDRHDLAPGRPGRVAAWR